MNCGYKKQVSGSFSEVLEKTKKELEKEGFGVLTKINVKSTLKKKINVNYDNYVILGSCNPQFAYKALLAEKEVGLLLPCNVIVYEDNGKIYVSAILPTVVISINENSELTDIAKKVEEKIKRVVDNI